MTPGPLVGELACLAAAVCWAVAVSWFRGAIAEHGARTVNLAKNGLATVLLGATVLVGGQAASLTRIPSSAFGWMVLSALLGLTLGDTALFAAVGRIGAHRALLLMTLVPVFAVGLAWAWRGESLAGLQILGAVVTLAGVLLVLGGRAGSRDARGASDPAGYGLAVLGAFGQAAGLVLAKEAMTDMPVLPASFLRMAVGTLGLVLVLAVDRRLGGALRALTRRGTAIQVVPAALLGTYLAFVLMMAGIAWAPAGVVAVLLATSPVWSLFVEARIDRRSVTARELLGTAIAVVGVAGLVAA